MKIKKQPKISIDSWTCLLYVTSFIWIFPGSNFILPLILWLLTKHKSLVLEVHGKNILNFQLSWFFIGIAIWMPLCFLSCSGTFSCIFGTIPTHILVFGLVGTLGYVFILAATISAYHGGLLELPLAYSFFK
jgi:uncharacterized Tic20 family protein